MSATRNASGQIRLVIVLLILLLLGLSAVAQAQIRNSSSDHLPRQLEQFQTGVWLVTYGPGDIYWQRFGHNGIWIRDEDLGLDHVFNFGFFDFEQEDFFWRFLRGRMLYFSAAQPAQLEFAQYIDENRSIRLQKLALNQEQALRLADFLIREVQPENRDYLYDYYLNNCSTRVRDALDFALDGNLHEEFSGQPSRQNFRNHTRRLTAADFWLYLGLELVLGRPVDRAISRWDEFFIPAELADGLTQLPNADQLLLEDVMLYQSSLEAAQASASMRWPLYVVLTSLLLAVLGWLGRKSSPSRRAAYARGWLVFTGLIGAAMVFFWFGTDHAVAAVNFNLLLFNPVFLLLLVAGLQRPMAWLVLATGMLALLQSLVPAPPGQYTADVVAAFLPFNLFAAWLVLRSRSKN